MNLKEDQSILADVAGWGRLKYETNGVRQDRIIFNGKI